MGLSVVSDGVIRHQQTDVAVIGRFVVAFPPSSIAGSTETAQHGVAVVLQSAILDRHVATGNDAEPALASRWIRAGDGALIEWIRGAGGRCARPF